MWTQYQFHKMGLEDRPIKESHILAHISILNTPPWKFFHQ